MHKIALLMAVIATGCAHQALMPADAAPMLRAGDDKALVVFARPARFGASSPTVIDESGTVLGTVRGGAWFAVEVSPGAHDFVVFSDDAQMVRAECAAGKVYVVEIVGAPGVMGARFDATAWSSDDVDELHRELSQLAPLAVNSRPRVDDPQQWLRRASEAFAELHEDARRAHTLMPGDGFDGL